MQRILILLSAVLGALTAAAAPVSLYPAPGATRVCPDTHLILQFDSAPALGSGSVRIIDAADGKVSDRIDVASPVVARPIGGLPGFNVRAVWVSDYAVHVVPRKGSLEYGHTYRVEWDSGAFAAKPAKGKGGAQAPWSFTIRADPPPPASTTLQVSQDACGRGDFFTIQGALDFVPEGEHPPVTIRVASGTYDEIVFVADKRSIRILGESRSRTVLEYPNNAKFNPSGNPYAGGADPSAQQKPRGSIYRRGVFIGHRLEDFAISNLTIRNTTPHGGSQAEAIILNGTLQARSVLSNLDLFSFQDTLQVNGQACVKDCYIEGDVDFLWGTGPTYLQDCVLRAVAPGRYFTQIRNGAGNHGFVFKNCRFECAPGCDGSYLARIEARRFPRSEVVLLGCTIDGSVCPVGWQIQDAQPAPEVHFWEAGSRDGSGAPIDASARLSWSRQLRSPQDDGLIAQYSDPAFVLGGWNPAAGDPAVK